MKLSDNKSPYQPASALPPENFTVLRLLTGMLLAGGMAIALNGCSNGQPEVVNPPATPPLEKTTARPDRLKNIAVEAEDAITFAPQAQISSDRSEHLHSAARLVSNQGIHYPQPIVDHPLYRGTPNTEKYPEANDNPVRQVATHPVSTFSIDVDTAAYANTRRTINSGRLPNRDAVRVEEFINYFNYSYAQPDRTEGPFSVTTEVGPSPWNTDRKLMLVGLQGYDIDRSELPPANLVFLIDVSGSMNSPQKLGLLKSSMKMLTQQLRPQDTISIAVYAGAAGEVLAPTKGNERQKIIAAIDALNAGGSTNGGAGINLAYALAQQKQHPDGINRVILATDGDFNVGTSSPAALGALIEAKRKTGVSLTVLGFGAGNYNDAIMQELAQKGNGNAAYIDTLNEARKVLIDEMGSTFETIAKDVKIQVEFNPALVSEYRLIGYETRHLNREDFNNDKVDAGDIGAGHSVTALYELTMADAVQPTFDNLRYSRDTVAQAVSALAANSELAHVKLRYKAPNGSTSKLIEQTVAASATKDALNSTSENYRWAAAASAYGALLRGSNYTGTFSYRDALALAQTARGQDAFGYRRELENLLRTTEALQNSPDRISMR